jgi:surface antigen
VVAAVRKLTSAVLVVALGATALGGCETVERETGLGKGAQTGVLGGAATGGVIAAIAGASPAWIAGSIILGAVAGGVLGDYLSKRDREQHAESSYQAFETEKTGGQSSWSNPESGNSGTTRIDAVYRTSDGKLCKDFTQTITAGDKTETMNGTTCQEADGTWKVI